MAGFQVEEGSITTLGYKRRHLRNGFVLVLEKGLNTLSMNLLMVKKKKLGCKKF